MFEIAVVYESSVFEPLKFYCILFQCYVNNARTYMNSTLKPFM